MVAICMASREKGLRTFAQNPDGVGNRAISFNRFQIQTMKGYTSGLPICITENGMASAERLQNDDRMDYLNRHLAAVRDALAQDVPVKGCFVWSLL